MMDKKEALRLTVKQVYRTICDRQETGLLKPHLGAQGYVILLQDKLERALTETSGNPGEVLIDAAADAVFALHLFILSQLPPIEEQEEEPEEDESIQDKEIEHIIGQEPEANILPESGEVGGDVTYP